MESVIASRIASLRAKAAQPMALGEQTALVQAVALDLRDLFLGRFFPMIATGLLCLKAAEALVKRWGLDRQLLIKTRQGLPHNKTTAMDLQLWALAKRVTADPDANALLKGQDRDSLVDQFHGGKLPRSLQEGMAEFLARYGHRGLREIDIGMPRWGDDPGYLLGVLQGYAGADGVQAPPDRHFEQLAAEGEQAVSALVARAREQRFGWVKSMVLGFLLGRYRRLGGFRESPKFYMMWLFQALRQAMLAAGEQLVSHGLLDEPADVRYLRIEELTGPNGHPLRQLVAERQKAYRRELERKRVPRLLSSEGEAFYGEVVTIEGNALSGTAVSPGVARGNAHVIRNPIGAKLSAGEILVAPSTDPAWTPLFLTAAGLVMEAGGMMSHGAVVAREYGIPAVVGVPEATDRIATGQQVEVDGNEGLVKLS